MFRFKFGLIVGLAVGWLVGTGKAAELLDRFRRDRKTGTAAPSAGDDVYDFAVRAAQ